MTPAMPPDRDVDLPVAELPLEPLLIGSASAR
jgi:hypothetical protein